jgi:hypothetical protein
MTYTVDFSTNPIALKRWVVKAQKEKLSEG